MKLEAVRKGAWKLHLAVAESGDNGKAIQKKGEPRGVKPALLPQLFNLTEDISESSDLAEKHPEITAELMALAEEMDSDLGRNKVGPGCRALGEVGNPAPSNRTPQPL